MLTVKQPSTYGYQSVHSLPTPPSTSRLSPPLIYQESSYQRSMLPLSRSHSPTRQLMSAPHRGLPPPAAMALPPQPPPSTGGPQTPQYQQPPQLSQPHHHQVSHHWTTLPAPPQQWSGSEESMKTWLQTRVEEERTKQEEEKTRQESLRLEQRKLEMDMLRSSLGGGIPPSMIPLVFAGMSSGGIISQAALEWAQQFTPASEAHRLQQLMPGHGRSSPEHQREASASAHGQYFGATSTPGSAQAPGPYGQYPASPITQRGHPLPGVVGRPLASSSGLPSLSTNIPQHGQQIGQGVPGAMASHQSYQPHSHVQSQSGQSEESPSIYFHHWQPPSSQAGGSSLNRPGSPTGDTPRKRRAMGLSHPAPHSTDQRLRSPPSFAQSSSSNPSAGRRGHRRLRSDVSWYRASAQEGRSESPERSHSRRDASPAQGTTASAGRDKAGRDKHSVSSLLSERPPQALRDQGPVSSWDSQPDRAASTSTSGAERRGGEGTERAEHPSGRKPLVDSRRDT